MTIQIDPEFQALIPALTKDERQQLEVNLKADGCRDPLVVWNGVLLDGHHRFEICTKQKLVYRTVEIGCADRDDAKAWIIRNQFGRRNLQLFQRAELALALKPLIAIEARRRQAATHLIGRGKQRNPMVALNSGEPQKTNKATDRELAKVANVGHQIIQRAAVIKAHAAPEVQQALREGKTTINREYTKIKQRTKKEPVFDGRRILQEIEQHVTRDFTACPFPWRVRFLEHLRLLHERLLKAEKGRRAKAPGITIEFNAAPPRTRAN